MGPLHSSLRFPFAITLILALICTETSAGRCIAEQRSASVSLKRIDDEWSIRDPDRLTAYVRNLGIRLVVAADAIHDPWHFEVVRNLSANAFSIGNGYIFVNEGALLKANYESEIAAVLAHEIGHQIAGHFCAPAHEIKKSAANSKPFWDLGPSHSDSSSQRKIGTITQRIDIIKELEADRSAVDILDSAGFNPHAMLHIAQRFPIFDSATDSRNRWRIQMLKSVLYDVKHRRPENSNDFRELQTYLASQFK